MFMIEIAGVKILYTGDFSREQDRHLMAAEMPLMKPDVLIIEATYGIKIHEKREEREHRYVDNVPNLMCCFVSQPTNFIGAADRLVGIISIEYS